MPNKIRKINQLKTIESFIQTNLFKGNSYFNKAGEIINSFYEDTKPPQYSLNLEGLVILRPDNITEELKVSPEIFWTRYVNPGSLDQIANAHIKKTTRVTEILNVREITRIGWRNYFVYEFQSELDRNNVFEKFSIGKFLKTELSVFTMKLENITFRVLIRKVHKNSEPKTPAMLIDVDAFKSFEKPIPVENSGKTINRIRELIQSREFVDEINEIIK
jgi:hypothetical protein